MNAGGPGIGVIGPRMDVSGRVRRCVALKPRHVLILYGVFKMTRNSRDEFVRRNKGIFVDVSYLACSENEQWSRY